jgi:DNA-binding response OmpR family regulator
MKRPLKLLIIEDSPDDAELLLRQLKASGFQPDSERVEQADALIGALTRRSWDLVISDWTMPRLRGRDALAIVRAADEEVPFIIVSGTVGEHNAVEAMRAGAQDYVLKGNLARLPPAVERELRERKARALFPAGVQQRLVLDSLAEGIYTVDLQGNCTMANAACLRMLGYRDEGELLGTALDGEILRRKDGSHFPAAIRSLPLLRDGERIGAVVSFVEMSPSSR